MTDSERTDHQSDTDEEDSEPTDADEASAGDGGFAPDPDRVATLREIADDVRGESGESKQLANVLYRTSDLYDSDEDVTPEEVVRNVKFILEVKERGGLER